MRTLTTALLLTLCTATAAGDERQTIAFHLPGQFKAAVAEAKASRRPILFKGVGQIVDDLACKDANRGHC